jgi:hypothetical protein
MELAGLEPATSWVRFGRPDRSNSAALQGIWRPTARRGLFPITGVCRRFTAVKATVRRCGLNPSGTAELAEGAVAQADETATTRGAPSAVPAAPVVRCSLSNEGSSDKPAVSVSADSCASSGASATWPPTETPAPSLKRRRMAADKARPRVLPASSSPPLRGPPARFRSTASDCSAVRLTGARWRRVARPGRGGSPARVRGGVVPRCAAAEPPAGQWPVG